MVLQMLMPVIVCHPLPRRVPLRFSQKSTAQGEQPRREERYVQSMRAAVSMLRRPCCRAIRALKWVQEKLLQLSGSSRTPPQRATVDHWLPTPDSLGSSCTGRDAILHKCLQCVGRAAHLPKATSRAPAHAREGPAQKSPASPQHAWRPRTGPPRPSSRAWRPAAPPLRLPAACAASHSPAGHISRALATCLKFLNKCTGATAHCERLGGQLALRCSTGP